MKQILLDNAYEAWKEAVYYHDKIELGFSSLQYQKGFVSALHNATELFFKQIMLNQNDKDVAEIYKKEKQTFPNLDGQYSVATNLNLFFEGLQPAEVKAFRSIEYGKLIGKHVQLLGLTNCNYKSQLELLQQLRNAEMHFYINGNHFLSEEDFVELHNFMVEFYDSIMRLKLFPQAIMDFDSLKCTLIDESAELSFERQSLTVFSYKETLKNNPLFCEIKMLLQGEFEGEYATYYGNNYGMAQAIVGNNAKLRDRFNDVYLVIQLMEKYTLFQVIVSEDEIELDDGQTYVNRECAFTFKE